MDFKAVLGVMRQAGFAGPLCLEKVPGTSVSACKAAKPPPRLTNRSHQQTDRCSRERGSERQLSFASTALSGLKQKCVSQVSEVNANFVRARQYLQRLVEDTRPAASSSSL